MFLNFLLSGIIACCVFCFKLQDQAARKVAYNRSHAAVVMGHYVHATPRTLHGLCACCYPQVMVWVPADLEAASSGWGLLLPASRVGFQP